MPPKGRAPGPAPPSRRNNDDPVVVKEPRRQVVTPTVEMKRLRWKSFQVGINLKEDGTIWEKVTEVDIEPYRKDELDRLYSKVHFTRRPCADGDARVEAGPAAELHLIKGVLRCGVDMAIKRFPEPESLALALREYDQATLLRNAPEGTQLSEQLQLIRANTCPTAEQKETLEKMCCANPDMKLGSIETYMWQVSRVPAYSERVDCWFYLCTCEEHFKMLRMDITKFSTILRCFRSVSLQPLLGLFLTVGNYLNGGTRDGRADGFHLDALKSGGFDAIRDNDHTGDLRKFVISYFLNGFRTDATTLIKDFVPAFKNVKRRLQQTDKGGAFTCQKHVKVSLEQSCDCVLSRLRQDLAENKIKFEEVQKIGDVNEDGSWISSQLGYVEGQLDEIQRLRDQVADEYKQLLHFFHCEGYTSEQFFLLWDNFLIPSECFESQPPEKVKSQMKPVFVDESLEIDVYGLGRLWEVEVGGLPSSSRSSSVTPRGTPRGSPSEGGSSAPQRGTPRGRSPSQPGLPFRHAPGYRSPSSRPAEAVIQTVRGDLSAASTDATLGGASSHAHLPPRPPPRGKWTPPRQNSPPEPSLNNTVDGNIRRGRSPDSRGSEDAAEGATSVTVSSSPTSGDRKLELSLPPETTRLTPETSRRMQAKCVERIASAPAMLQDQQRQQQVIVQLAGVQQDALVGCPDQQVAERPRCAPPSRLVRAPERLPFGPPARDVRAQAGMLPSAPAAQPEESKRDAMALLNAGVSSSLLPETAAPTLVVDALSATPRSMVFPGLLSRAPLLEPEAPIVPETCVESAQVPPHTETLPMLLGSESLILPTDHDVRAEYTLKELQDPECWIHLGVDAFRRETYLSDEEFMSVFRMDRDAFAKLPPLTKKQRKKRVDLL